MMSEHLADEIEALPARYGYRGQAVQKIMNADVDCHGVRRNLEGGFGVLKIRDKPLKKLTRLRRVEPRSPRSADWWTKRVSPPGTSILIRQAADRERALVLRFSQMVQPIPVRIGRRAVSRRWTANYPSDSVH